MFSSSSKKKAKDASAVATGDDGEYSTEDDLQYGGKINLKRLPINATLQLIHHTYSTKFWDFQRAARFNGKEGL